MPKHALLVLLGAGCLLLLPNLLSAKIERHVTRSFDVQPDGLLTIRTDGGGIKVESSPGNTVKIDVVERIDASSDSAADELLKKLNLTFEQNGSEVSSAAKYEGGRVSWFHLSWPPVQCEYVVTVPASFNVNLKTSGGGITVGDLHGRVVAQTSGGGLRFGHITGEITGNTSGGGITVESCTGDVAVDTSGGGITTGPISGKAKLNTSGGGITVHEVAGPVQAHTSGGPIEISMAGPVTSDSSFDTSGGGITLRIDPQAKFNLNAHTSGGRVHSKLPVEVQGEIKPERLVGKVNGGGPTITLRSSGGGISIVPR